MPSAAYQHICTCFYKSAANRLAPKTSVNTINMHPLSQGNKPLSVWSRLVRPCHCRTGEVRKYTEDG